VRYRFAVHLRTRNDRKARQQECDDTCGPMRHLFVAFQK
jgi:hypothetical protein